MGNTLTKFIFDKVGVPTSRTFLDLAAFRHKLISGNVANVSTPGYKARSIDFQIEFAKMTKKTDHLPGLITNTSHIPLGRNEARQPEIHEESVADGEMNSVDIDREMSGLAQNELLFTIGARILKKKFEGIRKAIVNK